MRLLFERGFAPTHAFCAFYRWIREEFRADAVLHFGTHGALEFMPGKQAGLSGSCWPDRLIGDLPNINLYASNNPSEGMIAKRRAAATLISYLTPPVAHAGLYRGLLDLKASIDRWRTMEPDTDPEQRDALETLIQAQAESVELRGSIERIAADLIELEYTLIPHGLHVIGEPPTQEERAGMLDAAGVTDPAERARLDALLAEDHELPAVIHALDGGYTRPAPGGDFLRTTDVLPTGRNLHGFDPFRIPSQFAVVDGARQADRLLTRHMEEGHGLPETVAMVLWGTDNLKTEGGPIAQALWLMGASPALRQLRPAVRRQADPADRARSRPGRRGDHPVRHLPRPPAAADQAAGRSRLLAAEADEPESENYIRKHALAFVAAQHGGTLEQAALRVFGNADGAYGANVNQMVGSGVWNDEDELADAFTTRKGFAYGVDGRASSQKAVLQHVLSSVEATYQNLDSIELGVTTVDHYFDTLGGVSRAVRQARGGVAASGLYRRPDPRRRHRPHALSEQVSLETRTRALNPKWYEALLKHGYEGVREIDAHVTNTLGWSATTGEVSPWVYQQLAETYVLDDAMRERLAALNPKASAKIAGR